MGRRIKHYAQDEIVAGRLPRGSDALLLEALLAGQFARGRAADITGYKDRQARNLMKALLARNLLQSPTLKGPVRLGFPVDVLERWLPGLYAGT